MKVGFDMPVGLVVRALVRTSEADERSWNLDIVQFSPTLSCSRLVDVHSFIAKE